MENISVLLIDDNRLSFEYLISLIDWKKHGFNIIGTAIDGEQGLALYKKYKAQIVITDIDMPVMNGIELAKEIRKNNEDTIILFLSHYDEFDYARSALQLGINDYMLKHEITPDNLLQKLNHSKNILLKNQTKQKKEFEENLKEYLLENRSLPDIQQNSTEQYCTLLLQIDHPLEITKQYTGFNPSATINYDDLKNIVMEISNNILYCIRLNHYTFLVLTDSKPNIDQLIGMSYRIQQRLEVEYDFTISILVSNIPETIERIKNSLQKKLNKLNLRYFKHLSTIMSSSEKNRIQEPPLNIRGFELAVKNNESKMVKISLTENFENIISAQNYDSLMEFTAFLLSILQKYNKEIIDFKTEKPFTAWELNDEKFWMTAMDIKSWFKDKFKELLEILANNLKSRHSIYVNDALLYIQKNYHNNNLSVESIAEYVGVSVNHLNAMFKSETSKTVHIFLTEIRVSKAKELLENKKLKIQQISHAVGYTNMQYFSRVFKKHTNMTPAEYRLQRNAI